MKTIIGLLIVVLVALVILVAFPTGLRADGMPCGMNGCMPQPPAQSIAR